MQTPKPVAVKKRNPKEKDVEAYLGKRVKDIGGKCYKWASMNMRGVPDRIVVLPGGNVWFIELKRDATCKPTVLQESFVKTMHDLGMFRSVILYGKPGVDQWLESRHA